MPALVLISRDSSLYEELVRTLAGRDWAVEWLGSGTYDDLQDDQEVVVLDAAHPEAEAWGTDRRKPVLLVVREDPPLELDELADDFAFRPLRGPDLVARLERLRARLAEGAETSATDERQAFAGRTALHHAAQLGDSLSAEKLVAIAPVEAELLSGAPNLNP